MAVEGAEEKADRGEGGVPLLRHALRDQEVLWAQVLDLAHLVESMLAQSVKALCEGRADLVADVVSEEREVNRCEVQIERECLRILTLYEPVASDLRRLAAALRVNQNLERIGDLAVHIGKRARKRAKNVASPPIPPAMVTLAGEVVAANRNALLALAHVDVDLARDVIAKDRLIDSHYRELMGDLKDSIRRNPDQVDAWFRLINVARNLERVADHATNIAEAVVFLREGDIIRHADRQQSPRESCQGQP